MPKRFRVGDYYVPIITTDIGRQALHEVRHLRQLVDGFGWSCELTQNQLSKCCEEYSWRLDEHAASGRILNVHDYFEQFGSKSDPFAVLSYSDDHGLVFARDFESPDELNAISSALSGQSVYAWPEDRFFHFDGYIFYNYFWEKSSSDYFLTTEEWELILKEAIDAERKKFERLRRKFSGDHEREHKRTVIPEEVRIFVWRRDDGKCVECGSQERLEYDHLIPVSKGGSSTARNVRLLCELCNRRKGDRI